MVSLKNPSANDVFEWTALCKQRIVINQGGTSSGKTWGILLYLLSIIRFSQRPVKISVVSETLPHLKRGAMNDFFQILKTSGLYDERCHNKSDYNYTIGDNTIEFFSADNPAKVRGARRDFLFINECNNVSWEVFDQLEVRTKTRIFLDYNPVAEFWVHERLIGKPNVFFRISTYKNNIYLDPAIRKSIESRQFIDPNWWKVYGMGETGLQEGLVYTKWYQVDRLPEGVDTYWYGLDFGFTNDPTSMVKVCMQNGEIWVKELFYEQGMTNMDISIRAEQNGIIKGYDEIIADSAEPKSINELKGYGWMIRGVTKGSDSVNHGINILKQYKINVTKDSTNLIKELRNYKWDQDKLTAKFLNKPIDFYNHAIDALRYVSMMKLNRRVFTMEQEN